MSTISPGQDIPTIDSQFQIPSDLTDAELAQLLGLGTNDDVVNAMFQQPAPHTTAMGALLGGAGDVLAKIHALRTYRRQGDALTSLAGKMRAKPQPTAGVNWPHDPFAVAGPSSYGIFGGEEG